MAAAAIPPALGFVLPRPPAPLALQREEFPACITDVIQMTAVQLTRLNTNGISTAEDVAMIDLDTLMGIPNGATPAMTKLRLKTLKQWIDTAFGEVVGLPTGTWIFGHLRTRHAATYSANYLGKAEPR